MDSGFSSRVVIPVISAAPSGSSAYSLLGSEALVFLHRAGPRHVTSCHAFFIMSCLVFLSWVSFSARWSRRDCHRRPRQRGTRPRGLVPGPVSSTKPSAGRTSGRWGLSPGGPAATTFVPRESMFGSARGEQGEGEKNSTDRGDVCVLWGFVFRQGKTICQLPVYPKIKIVGKVQTSAK